jgi:hypothetical protein
MARHQEPLDDLAFENVSLHDFGDIGFGSYPVPGSLGIDDDTGTILTMVQTPGLISSNGSLEAEPLHLFFKEGLKSLRALIGAASLRVAFRTLIDAHKNVMSERGHE